MASSTRSVVCLLVVIALLLVAHLNFSSYLGQATLGGKTQQEEKELLAIVNELQFELERLSSPQQWVGLGTPEERIHELEFQIQEIQHEIENLQLRMNSWMNYNSNPYLGSEQNRRLCPNASHLVEYGCKQTNGCPGLYDHPICLEVIRPRDCVVYDFGIRENPELGEVLVGTPFYCHVFAFDPSPITREWYEGRSPYGQDKAEKLRQHPNYTLFHYGAGGINGNVRLNEYDWGQVSIIRFPMKIMQNCNDVPTGKCKIDPSVHTGKTFSLPVRTLKSIMDELGHTKIDVLKVDVEGSEYMFLEKAIEDGVMDKVQQLTVEWHHHDFDSRYGGGSSPPINVLVALLKEHGLEQFFIQSVIGGWPTVEREYWEKRLDLRYNLASFVRTEMLP